MKVIQVAHIRISPSSCRECRALHATVLLLCIARSVVQFVRVQLAPSLTPLYNSIGIADAHTFYRTHRLTQATI